MTSLSEQVARVNGSELAIERELELLRKIEEASLLAKQQRAVMEQALEALQTITGVCQSDLETHFGKKMGGKIRKAITSLKQALGR